MEPEARTISEFTETQTEPNAISEQAHIFATDGFEVVLFPSGIVLMQGDNVIRLTPQEGISIAGAIMLMAGGSEEAPTDESA